MAVSFNYAKYLEAPNHAAGASGNFTSQAVANPNAALVLFCILDAGHVGVATVLDYYIQMTLYRTAGVDGAVTRTWSYKESGGAWTELSTGSTSDSPGTGTTVTVTGVLDGVELTLPIQFKLELTDADATWYVLFGHDLSAVRVVGTV